MNTPVSFASLNGERFGVIAARREHSRKPDAFYDRAARLYPGPCVEIFARQPRKGWTVWGNETTKFTEAA